MDVDKEALVGGCKHYAKDSDASDREDEGNRDGNLLGDHA